MKIKILMITEKRMFLNMPKRISKNNSARMARSRRQQRSANENENKTRECFMNIYKCTIVSGSNSTYSIYGTIALNFAVRRAPSQSNCDMFDKVLIYLL